MWRATTRQGHQWRARDGVKSLLGASPLLVDELAEPSQLLLAGPWHAGPKGEPLSIPVARDQLSSLYSMLYVNGKGVEHGETVEMECARKPASVGSSERAKGSLTTGVFRVPIRQRYQIE
jgi:hypothetical protein